MTAPAYATSPPGALGSWVDEVDDVMREVGWPLDPWQRDAIEVLTQYGPGGRWHTFAGAVVAPRQNGKTAGVIVPIVLADLLLWEPDEIAWSAHLFPTARSTFRHFRRLIAGSPLLKARVRKVYEANGSEMIEWKSDAILRFVARSKGGGRGLSGKRVILDEAMDLSADSLEALLPTLSSRPDGQVNYGSSAAREDSDALRSIVRRGRAGTDPALSYVEFCAPGSLREPGCAEPDCTHEVDTPGCALDDVDRWRLANPRQTVESLRAQRRELSPTGFAREFLGWHEGIDEDGDVLASLFAELADVPDRDALTGPTFAVDVAPAMRSASIAVAAWRPDGRAHVELADSRPGVLWVPDRLAELAARYPGATFGCAPIGVASALAPEWLREAGVTVTPLASGDYPRACAAFEKGLRAATFTHSGDPAVRRSLAGAGRTNGVEGLWTWRQRLSTTDLPPLIATTVALHSLTTKPAPAPVWGVLA